MCFHFALPGIGDGCNWVPALLITSYGGHITGLPSSRRRDCIFRFARRRPSRWFTLPGVEDVWDWALALLITQFPNSRCRGIDWIRERVRLTRRPRGWSSSVAGSGRTIQRRGMARISIARALLRSDFFQDGFIGRRLRVFVYLGTQTCKGVSIF